MTRIPVSSPFGKNIETAEIAVAAPSEALRALGLKNDGAVPDDTTPIAEVLLYGLTRVSGARPDHGIALGVAAELDALAMFIEGPLCVQLEMMARRIRTSVALAKRMSAAGSPPDEP